MARQTRRYIVTGRVQGVGFRYSALNAAQRLGLAGWVRNRRDGSVETVAQGDLLALAAYADWLKAGPSSARVDYVEESETVGEFHDFKIEDTVT